MEQAAARHGRQRLEAGDLDAAILQLGRRLLGDRHVATLQVDQHDVDRRARHAGQLHDRAQLAGVFDSQTFGNQNQRLGTVDVRQTLENLPEAEHRLVGVLADVPGDLRRLRDDVALALRALHRVTRAAFAVHDRDERQLVALLLDRDRFRDADVVLTGGGARLVADEALHRQAQLQLVGREADPRSRLGIGDERDLIERAQLIEEPLRGRHDRAQRSGSDVDLIDGNDDLPAVRRRQVTRVERLALISNLLLGGFNIDLDQFGGNDAANFAVDLHSEVWRTQIFNRSSIAIDHGDVNRDKVHTSPERWSLDGVRRLTGLRRSLARLRRLSWLRARGGLRALAGHGGQRSDRKQGGKQELHKRGSYASRWP